MEWFVVILYHLYSFLVDRSCLFQFFWLNQVVANDVDYKRSNLLIHQTKRTCTTNLMVTNNEGQHFPNCNTKRTLSKEASEINHHHIDQLLFDRVLCDVPCSGDGTLRKAPDIWRRWLSVYELPNLTFVNSNCFKILTCFPRFLHRNSGSGNGLHSLQVVLAMRGKSFSLQMVRLTESYVLNFSCVFWSQVYLC